MNFHFTEAQAQLARLWANVLNREESFELTDAFFAEGADSITTMRLVTLAREEGIALDVAEIFLNPTLHEMALKMNNNVPRQTTHKVAEPTEPSQTGRETPSYLIGDLAVSKIYLNQLARQTVEAVFPCTPLQTALFSVSERRPVLYLGQNVFRLRATTDISRFKRAVERVIKASPILRTIIFPSQMSSDHLIQVVTNDETVQWTEHVGSLQHFLSQDRQQNFNIGKNLYRVCLVCNPDQTPKVTYFVMTAHHAVYDGWSLAMQIRSIDIVYRGAVLPPTVSFQSFVERSILSEDEELCWKGQLGDFVGSDFPHLPDADYKPVTQASTSASIDTEPEVASPYTIGTILRAAWATIVATYINTDDVVIGSTLSGRNAPFGGIDRVNGPTFTTVPVRLRPVRSKPSLASKGVGLASLPR